MSINARIREARKVLNLTQKEFAKAICISNSYLADIENEARKSNDRIVKLISMIFGISEKWLKTGEGEIFYRGPDEKISRLVNIFNELPIDFQDYALDQIEKLLILRKKHNKRNI